jgi:alginate O-acetyltransferase complex protein AlgI
MIFNQHAFIFVFLPLILAAFYCPPLRRLRVYTLVAASFVFYGLSGIEHAITLAAGIVWVYLVTRSPAIIGNIWRLVLAIAPPFLGLFYYKYLGFFIEGVLGLGTGQESEVFDLFKDIILPAGISFFTFQLASFAVDRFRGDLPEVPDFGRFALYISFFPQLVAGPILRHRQVAGALERLTEFNLRSETASVAIGYICLGLAAKVLIADTLGSYQSVYISAPGSLSVFSALYVLFAYSFQIYFDFYGYSLIAIGLGRLFGFEFAMNFNRPYEALNPRDFWRRWHITLSYWIRDYLYLPLGGNHNYVRNILIVFAATGLWHGAGWTFVIWGLFHGVFVIVYHFASGPWNILPAFIQRALTFGLVSLGWTLFIFDFSGVKAFLWSLIGQSEAGVANPSMEAWLGLSVAALVCFGANFEKAAENLTRHTVTANVRTAGFAILFVVTLLFIDRSQTFIYFRF